MMPPPPGGRTPAGAARKRTAGKLARRKAAQAKLGAESPGPPPAG